MENNSHLTISNTPVRPYVGLIYSHYPNLINFFEVVGFCSSYPFALADSNNITKFPKSDTDVVIVKPHFKDDRRILWCFLNESLFYPMITGDLIVKDLIGE